MNRRDAFKMAAAAAAAATPILPAHAQVGLVEDMARALEQIPKLSLETEEHIRRHRERFDRMERLQQAIELGDRTAEELDCSFALHRDIRHSWIAYLVQGEHGPAIGWNDAEDPDPLTAVQKAREAALIARKPNEWIGPDPNTRTTQEVDDEQA